MPTVLILGANSDIAVALARKFASSGYALQLAARDVEKLRNIQSDCTIRYNIPCTTHAFDAAKPESHPAFFASLPARPDVTISVFGYLGEQTRAESDWQECHRILQVNYVGAVSILNLAAQEY